MGNENKQDEPQKRRGCWYWGCSITALAFVLAVFSCVTISQYGRYRVAPYLEDYLSDVAAENYAAAHARFTEKWRFENTIDDFILTHRAIRARLGTYKTGAATSVHLNLVPGEMSAQIGYAATFENGPCTIIATFVKDGERWLLTNAQYESHLLDGLYTCPKCGTPHDKPVNYCTRCGEPLEGYHPLPTRVVPVDA